MVPFILVNFLNLKKKKKGRRKSDLTLLANIRFALHSYARVSSTPKLNRLFIMNTFSHLFVASHWHTGTPPHTTIKGKDVLHLYIHNLLVYLSILHHIISM